MAGKWKCGQCDALVGSPAMQRSCPDDANGTHRLERDGTFPDPSLAIAPPMMQRRTALLDIEVICEESLKSPDPYPGLRAIQRIAREALNER